MCINLIELFGVWIVYVNRSRSNKEIIFVALISWTVVESNPIVGIGQQLERPRQYLDRETILN